MSKTWKCELCGYVHTGAEAPAFCPVCGADASHFSKLEITPSTLPKPRVWLPEPMRLAAHWNPSACRGGQVVGAALYSDMQLMGPLREAVKRVSASRKAPLCTSFYHN